VRDFHTLIAAAIVVGAVIAAVLVMALIVAGVGR
jgi:hypothetical protein